MNLYGPWSRLLTIPKGHTVSRLKWKRFGSYRGKERYPIPKRTGHTVPGKAGDAIPGFYIGCLWRYEPERIRQWIN
jgi:hypothetical protein